MCFCRSLIIKKKENAKWKKKPKKSRKTEHVLLFVNYDFCIGSKWKRINLNIKCTQDNCNCNNNCTLNILLLNGNVHCALCVARSAGRPCRPRRHRN